METKRIEFEKLKAAYIIVRRFIENETCEHVTNLNNKLAKDFGLTGDDNAELLDKFIVKFKLGYDHFDYKKHFYAETELFDSTVAFLNLLSLFIQFPLKVLELLTFKSIRFSYPDFVTPDRKAEDLTFRDLLTWYIEKDFRLSSDIRYEIKRKQL